MTKGDIIVSLDIGTSKVRAIIGELNGSTLSIIGVGSADGEGIRKGSIVDIDKTVQSIREAVEHAERMVGIKIESAFIGITGNHIALQPSHGVVAVSSPDREIGDEDVDRVLQAAKVIAVPPEREIIGVVPKQFIVDSLDEITDPRGMIGVRLEVEGSIITGSRTIISNLVRCVERAGLHNAGLVLMPLAASSIALSNDEKKLGVVLVDIGAGQTTVSVFENGVLSALSVLPIGGDHVTNDIAIGLRTQTEVAETVKLRYGYAMVSEASPEIMFKVSRIGSNVDKEFSQAELANIIEPRMQEIFSMVRREVERLGYVKEIPSGYVLSGGVACTPAVDKLAEFELEAPVRVAIPEYLGVRDSSFVNGVGIIQYAIKNYVRRSHNASNTPAHRKAGGFIERVKGWFSEFV
ncbi:cell division protein FtsA [Effusibacillus lacus]|uniref:Cell division protein FtsA n=1 Tax=Effusibacillus lacus TaxID=1348429 RepID=A0A292YQ12_9BACL|nr:cell division protein FtsA [Effusibacillus lacus]TCS75678.1 cell division protein FtsA [Effusibacillus lacus]GAX90999.1 cell division protein FtsA [Effusibacillus lacus]